MLRPPNTGVQPTRYARRVQWYFANVSYQSAERALPVTARG
jgi:hypothetical protein